MAYKVIILYQLYMPSYFLGTFTEYPQISDSTRGYFAFLDTLLNTQSDRENQVGEHLFMLCFVAGADTETDRIG